MSLRLFCYPCVEDDERLPIRVGVNGHNDVTRRGLEELIEMLRKCISEIFERGVVQPVSARWREVEKGRRNYR